MHIVGELDIATTPQLELTLREALSQARLVVLDLSGVAFIDGAGVHAIVNATVRARQAGRRLVLLSGPAHVERLFDLTGAAEHLERGVEGPAAGFLRAGWSPAHADAGRAGRGAPPA